MLVIVHHGYRKFFFQTRFNLETARRRNIFQVDAAKCRGNRLDCRYYFISILRREHNREAVNICKTFKKYGLAFHYGERRFGAELPSPSTAEPSETIATPFLVAVRSYVRALFLA